MGPGVPRRSLHLNRDSLWTQMCDKVTHNNREEAGVRHNNTLFFMHTATEHYALNVQHHAWLHDCGSPVWNQLSKRTNILINKI